MARVFVSYKRVEPDASVAKAIHDRLKAAGHEAFIDVNLPVGVRWAEAIEQELRRAEVLVALLSEAAISSDMTVGEIDAAVQLKKRILPVRLAYREPFRCPLNAWLNPINWAYWEGPDGTPKLAEELLRGIAGDELPIGEGPERGSLIRPLPRDALILEVGAMAVDSPRYVVRQTDEVALEAIRAKGGRTINVKGPRNVGKSSLLMRMIDAAIAAGKRVAFFDLLSVDSETLGNANTFYRQLCRETARELGLTGPADAEWDDSISGVQRCSRFIQDRVLRPLKEPVALVLDEVERVFDSPFRTDFFGMLRSWHNKRALPNAPEWKRLDLVLAASIEPSQFVTRVDQSPFNVGEPIELEEFSPAEVAQLNQLHGTVLGAAELARLTALVGGHPYLVRRALYLLARRAVGATDLLLGKDLDGGPFGEHLRHLLLLLNRHAALVDGLREVLRHGTCKDVMVLERLRGSGLVRQEQGRVVPRCDLYARYFEERLLG